jgi:hypothetical protein
MISPGSSASGRCDALALAATIPFRGSAAAYACGRCDRSPSPTDDRRRRPIAACPARIRRGPARAVGLAGAPARADYRLLVDVDESTWLAAGTDGQAFVAAVREHLSHTLPGLTLRVEAGGQ